MLHQGLVLLCPPCFLQLENCKWRGLVFYFFQASESRCRVQLPRAFGLRRTERRKP